jgi:hypothetical protein
MVRFHLNNFIRLPFDKSISFKSSHNCNWNTIFIMDIDLSKLALYISVGRSRWYTRIANISFHELLCISINLKKSYYLHIQSNLYNTIIPHSSILTELYNILHSNTEHVLSNCVIILTKVPTQNCGCNIYNQIIV